MSVEDRLLGIRQALHGEYASRKARSWLPLWTFIIHVLTGAVVFSVIALAALGIHYVRSAMDIFAVSKLVSKVLLSLELIVIFIDCTLFIIFLVRTSYGLIKETWSTDKRGSE